MTTAKATWYLEELQVKLRDASDDTLDKVAFQILGESLPNVPVDTGFLRASGFVISALNNTYHGAEGMAPMPTLGNAQALVAFGANYAIYQEARQSFLYAAAVRVAGQVDALVSATFKAHL